MKIQKSDLKRKIQNVKIKRAENKPQLLQNVHRQLHRRIYDLDYLQWMQRNSIRYTVGICILAILLSAAVVWRQNDFITDEAERYSYSPADYAVQPQVLTQPPVNTASQIEIEKGIAAADDEGSNLQFVEQTEQNQEEENEQNEQESEGSAIKESAAPEYVYFDPMNLSGYQAPCSGRILHHYGVGYDPIYEDYRFHSALCYDVDSGEVHACVDGIVTQIQMNQQWQIVLQSAEGLVQYAGLQGCTAIVGDTVKAGETIGTVDGLLYIQAVKNK